MTKKVITYGTFDVFHVGHLRLLERLKKFGDFLVVAVSTDDFNQKKNKKSLIPFEQRMEIISSLRCVDEVIEERSWQQKSEDIQKLGISVFGMGSDWRGHFDYLSQYCEVVYLDRTQGVSSTIIRNSIKSNTSI